MAFLQTFINVVMIVVLAVPGFALRKARLLPDKAASVLAVVLLYVSQPFLMMSSLFDKAFEPSMLIDFLWVIVFAVALQLAVYFAAKLIFAKTKEDATRRACVACSYLGNVGFMGIPVMQMLFPENGEMVLYTVVYNIAFNAMCWTLGVYAVTGEKKSVKPYKIILNPPTIAVIIALPFFFCNVHIPEQVLTPISYLGNMTLPLSMIILGIRLADMRLLGVKKTASVAASAPSAVPIVAEQTKNGAVESAANVAEISDIASDCEIFDVNAGAPCSVPAAVSGSVPAEKTAGAQEFSADSSGRDASAGKGKRGIVDDPKVYLVALVKLLLSPLLSLGVMLLVQLVLPVDRYVVIAVYIIAAMPSASSALNFAEMYGGDKETAAASTLMNTLLCVITVPVLMLLCELI